MLIDQMFHRPEGAGAALAQVSYSLKGGGWSAVADQEYRYRPLIAPGGYHWCPQEEQQVLLLHTSDGDLCAGVPASAQALAPGEVSITGPTGSSIRLWADGTVTLTGPAGSSLHFAQDGTVTINGTTIPPTPKEA